MSKFLGFFCKNLKNSDNRTKSCHYPHIWTTQAASWQKQQNDCVPSEDSDQPGHPPSLSESSLSAWRKLWSLATHWEHSKDSDQTGQMLQYVTSERETLEFGRLIPKIFRARKIWKTWFLDMGTFSWQNATDTSQFILTVYINSE